MKLLFFSDLHLGSGMFKGRSGREDMLELGFDILHQVLAKAEELQATVVFGGDWFDQPLNVNIDALNGSIEILKNHRYVNVYAISGNHDLTTKATFNPDSEGDFRYQRTSLDVLKYACENFILMDNSYFMQKDGVTVWLVPYFNSGYDFHSFLDYYWDKYHDTERNKGKNILVMHQTPQGNALNLPADVDMEGYKFDWVLCGHIHKPSQDGNLIVMGNPYQRDAGDFGQDKYIYLYDTQDDSWEPIKLKYPEVAQSVASLQGVVVPTETTEELTEVYQTNDKVQILAEYCGDNFLLEYIKPYLQ
jgi:DNA repair exonuclease SbcCD nuclease subunit